MVLLSVWSERRGNKANIVLDPQRVNGCVGLLCIVTLPCIIEGLLPPKVNTYTREQIKASVSIVYSDFTPLLLCESVKHVVWFCLEVV